MDISGFENYPYILYDINGGPMDGCELTIYITGCLYEEPDPINNYIPSITFEVDNLTSVLYLGSRCFIPHYFNYFPFLDEVIENEHGRLLRAYVDN